MPKSLLNCIPEKNIHQVAESKIVASDITTYEAINVHLESFAEPYRSLFFWLLDLMVCIISYYLLVFSFHVLIQFDCYSPR